MIYTALLDLLMASRSRTKNKHIWIRIHIYIYICIYLNSSLRSTSCTWALAKFMQFSLSVNAILLLSSGYVSLLIATIYVPSSVEEISRHNATKNCLRRQNIFFFTILLHLDVKNTLAHFSYAQIALIYVYLSSNLI